MLPSGRLQSHGAMSSQESCNNFMGSIKKLLKNYRSLLQNLREEHTLLFVLHVFFVGAAVFTLIVVLLAGIFRWLG